MWKLGSWWWWSSGQRASLLLRWSEFESRWSLQFFCKIVFEMNENKQKVAGVGTLLKNVVTWVTQCFLWHLSLGFIITSIFYKRLWPRRPRSLLNLDARFRYWGQFDSGTLDRIIRCCRHRVGLRVGDGGQRVPARVSNPWDILASKPRLDQVTSSPTSGLCRRVLRVGRRTGFNTIKLFFAPIELP